jgi:hypothetical protein
MSENGEYSVWYHTPRGESAGRLILEDGKITGQGTALSFSGSYVVTGNTFIATIKTWRQSKEVASVLGMDDLEIVVTGNAPDGKIVASCRGYPPSSRQVSCMSNSRPSTRSWMVTAESAVL